MNSRVALITFLDGGGGGQIDNTLPSGPNYPSQGLPGGPNYPSGGPVYPGGPVDPGYGQGHPRPPYPGNALPFPPVTPDNTLPEVPGVPPTISLPIYLPPVINPTPPGHTRKFELKYSYRYGWVLVPVDSDSIDNTLPPTAEPK